MWPSTTCHGHEPVTQIAWTGSKYFKIVTKKNLQFSLLPNSPIPRSMGYYVTSQSCSVRSIAIWDHLQYLSKCGNPTIPQVKMPSNLFYLHFLMVPKIPRRLLFRSVVCSNHTYRPTKKCIRTCRSIVHIICIDSASAPSVQVGVIFFAKLGIGLEEDGANLETSFFANVRAQNVLEYVILSCKCKTCTKKI